MSIYPLNLKNSRTWPKKLQEFLDQHHEVFLGWETGSPHIGAVQFERSMSSLMGAIKPYTVRGWHCTRLTTKEIKHIIQRGMQLPCSSMLNNRIDALVNCGEISEKVSQKLKSHNQSNEEARKGMLWFCLFEPHMAGERGIERFFRHWGGEALYNFHKEDSVVSPILQNIGIPCIVEADIPISYISKHGGLSFKIVSRFLVDRGMSSEEPLEHEDRIKQPLESRYIRRIIQFPEQDFISLTLCDRWSCSIKAKPVA